MPLIEEYMLIIKKYKTLQKYMELKKENAFEVIQNLSLRHTITVISLMCPPGLCDMPPTQTDIRLWIFFN